VPRRLARAAVGRILGRESVDVQVSCSAQLMLAIVSGMDVLLRNHRGVKVAALLALPCLALAAVGCGSSGNAGSSTPPKPSGTVNVAYASSLQYLNDKVVGPAFTKAEGYKYQGQGAASGTLESEIASGEIHPNVFESVGGDNVTPLFPKFTKWYVQYAGTSIVVAYNPNSKYASQFKAFADGSKPLSGLFTLMETPGFKLGRTDPNVDPQGRDFIYMLELAQTHYHLPADTVTKILGGPTGSATSTQIYAESSLDSTLQSGQLDASSAFITQAIELHLDYIPLPTAINLGDAALATEYHNASVTITPAGSTATTKHGSPQVIDITIIGKPTPAAIAFVKYTLSKAGLALYKTGGFTILTPSTTGTTSAVPAAITSELGG
jgi:molybdate/tungstate transport system substrate-binding protein